MIDTALLHIELLSDPIEDPTEHHVVRARRVAEYIRHRFPAVRYNDAPEDVDDDVGRA